MAKRCPHCFVEIGIAGQCRLCNNPHDVICRPRCRKCGEPGVYSEGLCYPCWFYRRS